MQVSHIYRTVNVVVHSLAQHLTLFTAVVEWVSDYPPWLSTLVSLNSAK